MISILSKISEYEASFITDNYKAQIVISNSESIKDIKFYVENILHELRNGNKQVINVAKNVALPLSYRFAIDDTSCNYRISSEIKEEIFRLEFSDKELKSIEEEIDWLCQSGFGFSYMAMDGLLESIFDDLKGFTHSLSEKWYVYGRVKTTSSILAKFFRFKIEKKMPKDTSIETKENINLILSQFEKQVAMRLLYNDTIVYKPYKFEQLKWILADFVAFTIQLKEDNNIKNRNLGSAKSKYKSVFKKFLELFPNQVFFGPSYSNSWHINRMVSYIEYKAGSSIKIPFELFIRTDYDYFVGYGNYWRYKEIDLFTTSNKENETSQKAFNNRVKKYKTFSEVQNAIFEDVTTGQLDLF
jgi:hypothetical protein